MTWIEKLERVPPKLLRIFAITGNQNRCRRIKTRREIARDGGLSEFTVRKVGKLSSWRSLQLSTIEAYIKGCEVDPLNRSQVRERIRLYSRPDRKRQFLANSSPDQRKMVSRILETLKSERSC